MSTICELAQLYTEIFKFLGSFMEWKGSRGKRFWSSLNKDFIAENIQRPLAEILQLSNYLTREAGLRHRDITIGISQITKDMNQKLDGVKSTQEKTEKYLKILQEEKEKERQKGGFDNLARIQETIQSLGNRVGTRGIIFLEGQAVCIMYDLNQDGKPNLSRVSIRGRLRYRQIQ